MAVVCWLNYNVISILFCFFKSLGIIDGCIFETCGLLYHSSIYNVFSSDGVLFGILYEQVNKRVEFDGFKPFTSIEIKTVFKILPNIATKNFEKFTGLHLVQLNSICFYVSFFVFLLSFVCQQRVMPSVSTVKLNYI